MADVTALRRPALTQAALQHDHDLAVTIKPAMARFVLRGDATVAGAAGTGFGVPIPTRPLSAATADSRAALWLGPDEWLLLAPAAEQAAAAHMLKLALAELPHSLVDVSHRQIAFALRGRLAARVLTSGCPLDLSLKAFPVGMVTRTVFHKAEIVLWRMAEGFHLEIWRSFAAYAAGHLAEARRGAEGLSDRALP